MNKKASLADKISSILSTAPASFNPDEDDTEETAAKLTEGALEGEDDEDDLLIGSFRRQNAELLEDIDAKYAGKKSSRKRLRDSDDDWETEEDAEEEPESDGKEDEDAESNLEEENVDNDSDDDSKEEDEGESGSGSSEEEEDDDDDGEGVSFDDPNFQHMKEQDIPTQMKKGLCVRNQLNMWESFLEMRIQMQKCLLAANKMPQSDHYAVIAKDSGNDFTSKANETRKSICTALDKLLELQSLVWKKHPETKMLLKKTSEQGKEKSEGSDEEIPSDTDVEESEDDEEETDDKKPRKRIKLMDYENDISDTHTKYKDYRNSVIQKWNDKTRIGSVKSTTATHSVLNQIEHILSDRPRLVKRTQTKRSNYEIIGIQEPTLDEQSESKLAVECSTEIFDDDDFYHQLLRELIEVKSAGVTDPIQLGRQWIQLQNLRSKMKRKIDTRATKGRKIRYTVHSKLVNFMAPMDEGTYTEDAKTELFSSLFGKKLGLQNNVI